jgi:WD40 repeat protein
VSSDDNKLKIWRLEGPDLIIIRAYDTDKFVTDVSWCSSTGIQQDMIATSCESNLVLIWKPDPQNTQNLIPSKINVGRPAWKVNWSPTGFLLAVNCGQDDEVRLYKEDASREWV